MSDVIIFAGTSEGRKLGEFLSSGGVKVSMCVATEYALQLISPNDNLEIISHRLDCDGMEKLIKEKRCDLVIDATHPYANIVTENIKSSTEKTGVQYLRLVRKAGNSRDERYIYKSTALEVADYLCENPMKTLLTIGSKELGHFVKIDGFEDMITARVLPFAEVLEKCTELGFRGKQLISMQGPFSHGLNVAMIKEVGAKCLVTKDSGDAGGFYEKLSAADEVGIKVIIIGRPTEEVGFGYDEMEKYLTNRFGLESERDTSRKMYPIFLSLEDKKIAVIGGGNIAERRIESMIRYGGDVTVISPKITPKLRSFVDDGIIKYFCEKYSSEILADFDIVLAATNDANVNSLVGHDAKIVGIMANVVDSKEKSDFYFPALIEGDKLVAGMISKNGDHRFVKSSAARLRKVWGDFEKDS